MSKKKIRTHEQMIKIIRAILVHQNGYGRKSLTDAIVEENEGSDLWEEIESIIDQTN